MTDGNLILSDTSDAAAPVTVSGSSIRTSPNVNEIVHVLVSDSISSHLRKMEDAERVRVEKQFVDRKPQTTYELTESGRTKFENHVRTLDSLIDGLDT